MQPSQVQIFKKWQSFISDEWQEAENPTDGHFRQWVIQKLSALFTMDEINTRRIQALEVRMSKDLK